MQGLAKPQSMRDVAFRVLAISERASVRNSHHERTIFVDAEYEMQLSKSVNAEIELAGFVCFVARYSSALKKQTDRDSSDSVIGLCRIMELSDQYPRIGTRRGLDLNIDKYTARLEEHLPDGGAPPHTFYEGM
jgi:hypothetical protein